jgi:hypothetical protein
MSVFKVTHVRKNQTSTKSKSPYFGNAPESLLSVEVRAATPEGATKKAEALQAGHPEWGDGSAWSVQSVENFDADPD